MTNIKGGQIPKRKSANRSKKRGKIILRTTPLLVRGRANAGNIGYSSQLSNAGVIRMRLKPKKRK